MKQTSMWFSCGCLKHHDDINTGSEYKQIWWPPTLCPNTLGCCYTRPAACVFAKSWVRDEKREREKKKVHAPINQKPRAGVSLQPHALDVSITHRQNFFDFSVHLHNDKPSQSKTNNQKTIKQRTKGKLVRVWENIISRNKNIALGVNSLQSPTHYSQCIR